MLQTCPQHVHSICCAVVGSITVLSKQKHASVVIEKCFQSGNILIYPFSYLYLNL